MRIFYSCFLLVFIAIGGHNLNGQSTPLLATCRDLDSIELRNLYNVTNGANWINKWDLTKPITTWYGVGLTNDGCNVARLVLDDNNLIGKLPKLNLPNLTHLSLRRNLLTDTIPNFIAPQLQYLNVSQNQLLGNVPNFTFVSPDSFFIDNNQFVYGDIIGKKWLSAKILAYAPQGKIAIGIRNDSLYVNTGVADNQQQFNWFKDNVYLGTFSSSVFKPTVSGMYYCLITHNTLTISNNIDKNLVLQSQNYAIHVSNGKRVLPLGLPDCLEDDFNQLEALYDSTGGTNWTNKSNWFTNPDMNTWFGLTLTADGCDLMQISLSNNNLVGIALSVTLPKLTLLDLSKNKLKGNIPNYNLPSLKTLNLSSNLLSGSIPSFNLSRLTVLKVDNNQLSATLPDLSALINLENFTFSKNNITGNLNSLKYLNSLISFDASFNQLTGDITEFSITLKTLALDNNNYVFADMLGKDWLKLANKRYAPQAKIPITVDAETASLQVSTGSLDADQVFNWYRKDPLNVLDMLVSTTAVGKFKPTLPGTYYCSITHKDASVKDLVLQSQSYIIRSSKGGRALPITLPVCLETCFNQLESFYDATNGNNWTLNKNWFTDANLNNWTGIVLTSDGCDIDSIKLNNNKLVGTLPNFNLPKLRSLNLSDNSLSGNLPKLDTLPQLVDLNLFNNQLSGNVPSFANTPNIAWLNLGKNQLSGSIPNFAQTQNIASLNLSNNKLSGSIPNFTLPKLTTLTLTSNVLSGLVPNLAGAANIAALQLDSNKLTGAIPDFNLPALVSLSLNNNQFSGDIPNFVGSASIAALQLQNNNFVFGDLAGKRWLNLTNLSYAPQATIPINLDANGILSVSTGAPDGDQTFNWYKDGVKVLTSNSSTYKPTSTGKFSCQITHNPLTVANNSLRNLVLQSRDTALRISNGGRFFPKGLRPCLEDDFNQLEALYDAMGGKTWKNNANWLVDSSLTNWYGIVLTADSCDVIKIDLSENKLVGTLPNLNLPFLDGLVLFSNSLSGSIPNFINLLNVTDIELDDNMLIGTIPNFNLPKLKYLFLTKNNLSGTVPDLFLPLLIDFEADTNKLSGNFPNLNLPNIRTLFLNNNQIIGAIPNFSFTSLKNLDLSNNALSGNVPNFNLPNLVTLYLDNNKLSGSIPPLLVGVNSLNSLDLSQNNLSGSIPDFNLPNLTNLYLNNNKLSGIVPNLSKAPNLYSLYLNNNTLSGNIPNFVLPQLFNLDLSFNQLSGSIPDLNLPNLDKLLLSNNQLSGTVTDLLKLTNLNQFYIDNNKFVFGDIVGKDWLTNVQLVTYAPQAKIPITLGSDGLLSVSTGTPDADQKFKWYKDGVLVASTTSSKYKPTVTGSYYVQATHNSLTNIADSTQNLVLQSENYNVGVSNGGRILPIGLAGCLVDDFNQLEALYDSTGGANWTNKANWLTNADLSKWDDVKLTADGCDVSELNLSINNLTGRFPNLNLPKITTLNAGINNLTGNIPNFNLPSLQVLLLESNKFSGNIPNLNLPALTKLDLSSNQLKGSIPDLAFSPQLLILNLNDNQLSGNIPDFTVNRQLSTLNLSNNQFIFGDMLNLVGLTNLRGLAYVPQAVIPITLDADGFLSVSTGAADADQKFNWYNNGALVATTQSSKFKPTHSGTWSSQVTHNTITIPSNPVRNLVLQSTSTTLRVSTSGRILPTGLPVCLEDDFNQLEALYDSTNGNSWINKTNWLTSGDMKSWFGVTLTADNCDVAEIKLVNNNLSGKLANLSLPNLVALDLSTNAITGVIPNFVETLHATSLLPALKNLNLNSNQFSGTVPRLITPNIVTLDLGSNKLTGSIPANLTYPRLLNLYLNNNQLIGSIPNLNIPTLTSLQLSSNQLTGSIPNFSFPNLTSLQLNNNQLSGSIPNFNFPNLTNLYLHQNQLSGSIPDFNFPKLLNLFLSNNQLSGAIPAFSKLVALNSLTLDNNAFIFGDIVGKPWLSVSALRYALQAKIPISFNNGLFSVSTGAVDADQTFKWYRKDAVTASNVLIATTQSSKYKPLISGTYSVQITHSTLTIPTDFFRNFILVSTDSAVRISNGGRVIPNTLPDCLVNAYNQLEALYDSTGGPRWTNNANWLTNGDMSSWSGVSLTADGCDVSTLSLGSNNLVGAIPNLNLPKLVVLDMSSNNLSGSIPNFAMPSLIVLNLGNNKLNGAVPNFNSPAIKGLLLSNNQLSGSIPNFSIPALKIIDLSFNKLTGSIPNFNLFFFSDLILQSNQLTGSIPNFKARFLKTIDVRDNFLSGDIPSLTSAPSLAVMYLQNNAFVFGDMVGKPWLNTPALAYNPQANIPLTLDAVTGSLQVSTGAADADQVFKWYVDGVLNATTQSSTYKPTTTGVFSCQITHNALTIAGDNSKNLILKTGGVTIRVSNGGRIFPTGLAACLEDDFNQLEALYDSTGGDNWTKKTNWFTNADMKTWYGVSLTTDNCDVSKISLGANNLIGRLPNLNLPQLTQFDASSNKLSGKVPDVAFSPQLSALILNNNQLSGNIPAFVLNRQLTTIDLSNNQLTGSIPDFNLTKLVTLNVSNNNLSGKAPNLAGAPSIATLQIQNNAFIFGDIEGKPWLNIATLSYAPQAIIPIALATDGLISVSTGATDANQTFKWYVDNVLVATTQNSKYKPTVTGTYSCQISHNTLTVPTNNAKNLVLQTQTISLRISKGGRIFPTGLAACLEDDFNQLEVLYDSTGGNSWTKKTNWLTNADMSTWFGVSLTTDKCDVDEVSLANNNLTGRLPNFNLPNLISLDLDTNKLTGNIPNLAFSPQLSALSLSKNQFSGNIPDFSGNANLLAIDLENNQFSGIVPSFTQNTQLLALGLANNQLSGKIPDFAAATKLKALSLENNAFVFGDMVAKRWLQTQNVASVSYAPQAKIPVSLSTDGILSVNTGASDADQIYKWFKNGVEVPNTNSSKFKPTSAGIYFCRATHNTITVASASEKNLILQSQDAVIRFSPGGRLIPIDLPVCLEKSFSQLEILYDSTAGNNWTNKANWFATADLNKWYGVSLMVDGCDVLVINLSNNNLKGVLPVVSFPNLKVLDASKNNLNGRIPNLSLPNLITLMLNDNQLAGDIPNFVGASNASLLPNLTTLDLSNNLLSSNIPTFIFPKLLSINLSNNVLTGVLPQLAFPELKSVNLSHNLLSGIIPSVFQTSTVSPLPNLMNLQLNDNLLTGTIPNFKLQSLTNLQLSNNHLSGDVPSFNLPNLVSLLLDNNQLVNGIPSFTLPKLQTLLLQNNLLSGNIPNFNLPQLQTLDVGFNNLSGDVPSLALSAQLSAFSFSNNSFIFGNIAGKPWLSLGSNITYSPQAKIAINFAKDSLSVETGEPDSTQQFKWFKDGNLVAITTTSRYMPALNGIYSCKVSHNTLTIATDVNRNLILQSENFEVSLFTVNFFSFTGKKGDTFNQLDWKTSLEVISDSFVVERSKDSINFAPIGALKAAGNSTVMLAYQFKDNAPLIGNNYYRIKAKDVTGKFVYSIIILISFNTATVDVNTDNILSVFPNPAKEVIGVRYQQSGISNQQSGVGYQVSDALGRVVQSGLLKDGDRLNISDLASGIYFLRAGNTAVKFVKN